MSAIVIINSIQVDSTPESLFRHFTVPNQPYSVMCCAFKCPDYMNLSSVFASPFSHCQSACILCAHSGRYNFTSFLLRECSCSGVGCYIFSLAMSCSKMTWKKNKRNYLRVTKENSRSTTIIHISRISIYRVLITFRFHVSKFAWL